MHNGANILKLVIFILLLTGIDLYVFQGIRTITATWNSDRNRLLLHWGYWIVSLIIIINLLFAFGQLVRYSEFNFFVKQAFNVFVVFTISKLAIITILFGEDIYRGIAALIRLISGNSNGSYIPGRRKFISQVAMAVAGLEMSSLIYGIIKGKYQYKLHKHTLFFKDLPEAFDGFKITQISDVHSGSFNNTEAVQKGIDLVKTQQSDLFVFTGDLVNNKAEEILPWMEHFKQIRAPYGQFSILGNHDYGEYVNWKSEEDKEQNLENLKKYHADLGYHLLLNNHVKIKKDGESIDLLGVENWGKGFVLEGDLDKSLEGAEQGSFKILLSHDPSHWDEIVKNHPAKIHLTLSGHTHGMQMGVETPLFKFSPVQFRYKNWAGMAEENGRYLYVNRGFGFIGYSGRIGIWPEVTVIELRKG